MRIFKKKKKKSCILLEQEIFSLSLSPTIKPFESVFIAKNFLSSSPERKRIFSKNVQKTRSNPRASHGAFVVSVQWRIIPDEIEATARIFHSMLMMPPNWRPLPFYRAAISRP